jgi:hypothetical protein
MIGEGYALKLMREGRPLIRLHSVNGLRWYVVPGGQVADVVAARILRRRDVQPGRNGLFPGVSQTFWLRKNWRKPCAPISAATKKPARR